MASKELHDPNGGEGKEAVGTQGSMAPGKPRAGVPRGLDPRSQEAIGRALKAHYNDLIQAPVPDKFMELLDRLEATERTAKSQSGDDDSN